MHAVVRTHTLAGNCVFLLLESKPNPCSFLKICFVEGSWQAP